MSPSSDPYDYQVFGLTLRSDLALPELPACPFDRPIDVTIRVAALDPALPRAPGLHRLEDATLLVIEGVGRYLARGGRALWVEPVPNVPPRNLRLFLLGSAMGLLLHQRGLLPLHANAVVIDGRAYAFTGPSGAGKSTLAAWFQDHGYRLLSDDVCVIGANDAGQAMVYPGLPRLRLWRDAVERSGRTPADFSRSYEEANDDWEKYDVPTRADAGATEATVLGGVFLLERAADPQIVRLSPAESLAVLFGNIYRGEYLAAHAHETAWRACLAVASRIPMFRWRRPWDAARFDKMATALVAEIRHHIAR